MSENLSYYLWHGFFGALLVGIPLQFMGLLPTWAMAALVYGLLGIAAVAMTWLAVRLIVWR